MQGCRFGRDWHGIVEMRASQTPDAVIYRFLTYSRDDQVTESLVTWSQLWRRALSVGAWLQEHHCAGQPVLLAYPPGLDFIEALFGCLFVNAIGVPATP